MEIRRRSPQQGRSSREGQSLTPSPSSPATPSGVPTPTFTSQSGDLAPSSAAGASNLASQIIADGETPTSSSLPTTLLSSTPTVSPSPTSSPSPSSSPAAAHGKFPPKTIVAIVVPIAVVLLLPLLYLLYRSHKMKKDAQDRSEQRDSREAMVAKEAKEAAMETKMKGPPPPRPRRSFSDLKKLPPPRPTNSLGLFNFDFSTPTSPTKDGQRTPPRLSLARSLHLRRSDVPAGDSGPRPQQSAPGNPQDPLRNNPSAGSRDSSTIVFGEPAPPYTNSGTVPESHFAPLDAIGTAISQPTRTRPTRDPPSGGSVPRMDQWPEPDAQPPAPPAKDKPVSQANRNFQSPTSTYSTSTHHSSALLPPLPTALSNRPPTPPQHSRPVSPLNGSSTRSTNTDKNYQIPSFGLGMGGGRFTLSDYEDPPGNQAQSHGERNDNLRLDTDVDPAGTRYPHGRISDVSGLSVDPDWLSQEERERRHEVEGARVSTSSRGPAISPVESHGSFRAKDRLR